MIALLLLATALWGALAIAAALYDHHTTGGSR